MTYKTENDIWKDMISLFNEALTAKQITGMTVMRAVQPVDVTGKSLVLLQRVNARRYGWRGRHETTVADTLHHIENYYKEMRFQVTVLKKIDITNIDELTASDIADMLVDYLLSNTGLKSLRSKGYMPLKIMEVREPSFSNESENYQIHPNFDLVCYVQQEIVEEQDVISKHEFNINGV